MEAIIFAIVLTYAVKKGAEWASEHWQGSKARNRRSTRGESIPKRAGSAVQHDMGYWAHQVLHGFPQVRHGLAGGWNAGRTAQTVGKAKRHQAKTDHLESRASLLEQIREHRKRREEAWNRIRAARKPEPELEWEQSDPEDPPGPDDEETSDLPDDIEGTEDPGRRPEPWPWPPGDDSEETPEGTSPAEEGTPPEQQESTQSRQGEGDRNVSETTYQDVKARMTAAQAAAEQRQAEASAAQDGCEERVQEAEAARNYAQTTEDEMQAMEVDAATLGAMAEHQDALSKAQEAEQALQEAATAANAAWTDVVETAGQVNNQLEASGHGALDEAHANAAGGGGKKEFYGDGG